MIKSIKNTTRNNQRINVRLSIRRTSFCLSVCLSAYLSLATIPYNIRNLLYLKLFLLGEKLNDDNYDIKMENVVYISVRCFISPPTHY